MRPSSAQLQHATTVATCRSFSEAARRCNVSQPTISNSVSDLEDLLGKKLFKRTTRKVELTPFGELILPVIGEAVVAIDRVLIEASAHLNPDKKLLRIAFTPLLNIKQVNVFCASYRLNHPDVEIVFKECSHESLEDRLFSERIDVVFAHDVPKKKEFRRCRLFQDQLHYVPANGEMGELVAGISLNQIAEKPLLLTDGSCGLAPTTLKLFRNSTIAPNLYGGRAMTHSALREWAELGLGGAVLPESQLSPSHKLFPKVEIDGKLQKIEYQAVWAEASEATPHLSKFVKELPKIVSAISP